MSIFSKPAFKSDRGRKREMPEGLWAKCASCGEVSHQIALETNQRVCPKCGHHMAISARERIANLTDPDSFTEMDADLTSADPLGFTGQASYKSRLESYQAKTGLREAVITGIGAIHGRRVGLAVLDFAFLAATMGSVVGEKITRCTERATKDRLPMVIISASGGARMYEGLLSLMQMAKTSGALARHARAHLPYISILTDPTTGGVTASFATLGDIILAEPKAMIGFAGPRVIRETTHQDLPPDFQKAEFLHKRGLIDRIVPRAQMRETLHRLLGYLQGHPALRAHRNPDLGPLEAGRKG